MKLPRDLSVRDLVKILERVGFVFQRQRGSHTILRRENPRSRVVVPDHKHLRPGTLRQVIEEAGLTLDQLTKLL